MPTQPKEENFQKHIMKHLGDELDYEIRNSADYSKKICIDKELALRFIKDTQKDVWDRFVKQYGNNSEERFFYRLSQDIEAKGTIDVLRKGIEDVGCKFELFYPRPNTTMNPELGIKHSKNIFSAIEELEYEEDKDQSNRIDITVFINGIPIITIELKEDFQQSIDDAVEQYKRDRNPNEKIFQTCFVHFAMSTDQIKMSTKLDKLKTEFLPFNKDLINPQPPNDYKTSYLYREILTKEILSDLISNYIFIEEDKKSKKSKLIFPRFHQLECSRDLIHDAAPGKDYLIQHSAGSGKTKTMAWLAHGLINKNDSSNNRVFDMIVVVSDRKIIDKQLYEQISSFEKTIGIVKKIKDSSVLTKSLESGQNIVVTTMQKFPHVLEKIESIPERKYAIIIDEAHSSQSGELSKKMVAVLNTDDLEKAELEDEENSQFEEDELEKISRLKNRKHIAFFGFTATPKSETIQRFGVKNEDGKKVPFHLYSMEQAIEEGFILDVLANFIDYDTWFEYRKSIHDDPKYKSAKAKQILINLVNRNPGNIKDKTRIILDHFLNSTINKIDNRAKAMIVTSSRAAAVMYKLAVDKKLQEDDITHVKSLVAFSGTVNHHGKEYTENTMNSLSGSTSIEGIFDENDEYKLLIVANKFQSGFDQPLLHTMYVDKKLKGLKAVQTMSRLNRIYPKKSDTLVIDFINAPDSIQESFQQWYGGVILTKDTNSHLLYDLKDKIFDTNSIFDKSHVENFNNSINSNASDYILHSLLNPIVSDYKDLSYNVKRDLKQLLGKYQKCFNLLSQILDFSALNLEHLFIFNKYLLKKLPTLDDSSHYDLIAEAELHQIRTYKKSEHIKKDGTSISLTSKPGEFRGLTDKLSPSIIDPKEKLSKIIKNLNEVFGNQFDDDSTKLLKIILDRLVNNSDLIISIKNNSRENASLDFSKHLEDEVNTIYEKNADLYKKINDNPKLKKELETKLFNIIYKEINEIQRNN